MKRFIAAAFALVLMSGSMGCADDEITTPATDRITVTPDVSSTTLATGSTSAVSIRITRPVGYAGPVSLTAENLPTGVSGTFAPSTLDNAVSVSTLTLRADAGAANGTSAVTVRASGTGIDSQTAQIDLIISNGGASGSFTISLAPPSVTVPRGGSTSATIAIARSGGFTGAVSIDISGFPAGVVASVSPATTSSSSASINISVGAGVAGGTYTAVVSAQAAGAAPQTATLSLTVLPAIRE